MQVTLRKCGVRNVIYCAECQTDGDAKTDHGQHW